jgi:hypothetical protein
MGAEDDVVITIEEVAHPEIGLYSRIVGVDETLTNPALPPIQKYLLLTVTLLPSLLNVGRKGPGVQLSVTKLYVSLELYAPVNQH